MRRGDEEGRARSITEARRDASRDARVSVVFVVMDIVVRSPHGNADVSIGEHSPDATLGDVIGAITGQAVPRLALVDGRSVSCATPLDDAGLVIGSIVTTEPPPSAPPGDAVELRQIAGYGAGRTVRLTEGRYRLGPGRRVAADELAEAPVESAAVELLIDPSGDPAVTVVAGDRAARIEGSRVDETAEWVRGVLTIGTRAFESDDASRQSRNEGARTADGRIAFNRPPRRTPIAPRHPVVDGVRDATLAAPTLWERRPDHDDAFILPFGITSGAGGSLPITIDLANEQGVAIAGSVDFRTALARALVVEATTLHGPADLEVVILTGRNRAAVWDWAKWLPHIRRSERPSVWQHDRTVTSWVSDHLHEEPDARLTLLIVDDPTLWTRVESPLRPILSNPPGQLRMVALCPAATDAPANATALVSETSDGTARLESFSGGQPVESILAALPEIDVAGEAARGMAALIDLDAPPSPIPAHSDVEIDLMALFGVSEATPAALLERWSSPATGVAIGGHDDQHTVLASDGRRAVRIVADSKVDGWDMATTITLGRCLDASPDSLWVMALGAPDDAQVAALWSLPHAVEPHDQNARLDVDRLTARIREVLTADDGPDDVLLILDEQGPFDNAALDRLAEVGAGLDVIIVTDRELRHRVVATTVIRVDHNASTTTAAVTEPSGDVGAPFAVFRSERSQAIPDIELHPAVIGRPLTPLERRIRQLSNRPPTHIDPQVDAIVRLLRAAAAERDGPHRLRRVLAPPPLPTQVDIDDLLRTNPGDGVPIGVIDHPEALETRPLWWAPGDGSLFLLGSRRSGIECVMTSIVLGVVDRFAPEDVSIVAIEQSASNRRALIRLDHTKSVVAGSSTVEVRRVLDDVTAELDRRLGAATPDVAPHVAGPRTILMIGDLSQLRRQLADPRLVERLDNVIISAQQKGSGIDVIAYVSDAENASPFFDSDARWLIGSAADVGDIAGLRPPPTDRRGRCRQHPTGELVQLATSDESLETLLEHRVTGAP